MLLKSNTAKAVHQQNQRRVLKSQIYHLPLTRRSLQRHFPSIQRHSRISIKKPTFMRRQHRNWLDAESDTPRF